MSKDATSEVRLQGKQQPTSSKPNQPKDENGACCRTMNIHLENHGTVNIANCAPTQNGAATPEPPAQECDLTNTGACVPLALGRKPKRALASKLRPYLKNNKVPSVLGAAFFQMARRYLADASPADQVETAAFGVFNSMPEDQKRILRCSLDMFDSLAVKDRDRLFAPSILGDTSKPVSRDRLAQLVTDELLSRAKLEAFGDSACANVERPGLVRFVPPSGGDDVGGFLAVEIYRVNGLRTNRFQPPLSLAEYLPEELQQACSLEVINNEVVSNCQNQTTPCPGNVINDTCLRVPDAHAGDSVTLEGVNFYSTNARVRLTAPFGAVIREVDGHVCGDIETPLTEVVDGVTQVITDSRVRDIITFQVPDDLPPAIYNVKVVVPPPGIQGLSEEIESQGAQFINVAPPETAVFQIATETLKAVKETSPAFFGSDEVGFRINVIPVGADLTPGEMVTHKFPSNDDPIIGNVDSGDERSINRVLFQGSGIGGVSLVVLGFEVDDEDVFEKQITSFQDAYEEILKSTWSAIAGSIGTLGGAIALAAGLSNFWATAIASAVTLVITIFVALWAPADLIMEDSVGLTALDIGMLTAPAFPEPPERSITSPGGIEVTVASAGKGTQYLERREYVSDDEGSEYHLLLRYNRLS